MHICMCACVHVCAPTDLADDVQTDRHCEESVSASVQNTDVILLPGPCKSWEHFMKRLH